jgi:hypothetical protein
MRPVISLIAAISLTSLPAFAKLEVHEWGTFTSLVGSNGITQNGMYHEDEPLPAFVHPFGEVAKPVSSTPAPEPTPILPRPCRGKMCMSQEFMNAQVVTQKMETPVLYFRSDKAVDVTVNVKFPKGVVTDTYPAPIVTTPTRETVTSLVNGDTTFKVQVLPLGDYGPLPFVGSDNIYSHARGVYANTIRSGNETEKFIFYRGIGQYQPDFKIYSTGGSVSIFGLAPHTPQVAYLIDVDANGDARLMKVRASEMQIFGGRYFSEKEILRLRDHSQRSAKVDNYGAILSGESVAAEIVTGLVQAGLHVDEAQAMLATWERGYLKVPGLRLLAILPRQDVDQILPLSISPAPESLERVFVSRIEILLESEEQKIMNDVIAKGESFDISTLGRFAEPKLRRVAEVCRANLCAPKNSGSLNDRIFQSLILRSSNIMEHSGSSSAQ